MDVDWPCSRLSRIPKAVVDMSGEPPGTASHLKLIGNVLIIQMIESVAEAHVLAKKTKLRPTYLDQVIQSVWPGPFAICSARMMSGDYYKKEVGIQPHSTQP
jgi:3-hydroxyisobutyrate dehydrogenase-like beta-hydroxyacid dehydrogenase